MNAKIGVPKPFNEKILDYKPGSAERAALKARIAEIKKDNPNIPLYIGGDEVRTGRLADCVSPHDHHVRLGRYHEGGAKEVKAAITAALKARAEWSRMPFEARAAIFLRAAELLAGDFRWTLNAATMLCQSKTAHQAEIDSACELIDFFRFNVHFAEGIYSGQPNSHPGTWNMMEMRPLEGFVYAVTPFNFTSIAGNLPTAPAILGNTVVWKPGATTVFTAHYIMKLLKAAGLPDGVINMVTGPAAQITDTVIDSPDFAGLHFTGSTAVFNGLWSTVGSKIGKYRNYPRLVGETGGKDFVFLHASADVDAAAVALLRGAFEFQGQKCSAASRAYIPDSLWPKLKKSLIGMMAEIKMGSPEDFGNFVNAVIDKKAFDRINGYIDRAKSSGKNKILSGGKADDSKGYFISPTLIQSQDPKGEHMTQEIFGPILTVYVYPEKRYRDTLRLCEVASPYALTGAVFATDRKAILEAREILEYAAGNFYINDKPTGAVVGQQPFGGARASGTNDKAGSYLNLLRWVNPLTIKETFNAPKSWRYPFLDNEEAA
jgi:1-pyrroline-5-carboxylate dehydrogenase